MKFSIIICGYNEAKNLDACISACLEQNYPRERFEIIYIDNNSTDGSLQIAQKYQIKAVLETKQGPSEARNRGISEASGDIFLFLDADAVPDPRYLNICEAAMGSDEIGACTGMVLPSHPTIVSNYLGVSLFEGYPRFQHKKYVYSAPSCNLAIKRPVIEKVGNFLENLDSGSGVTRFSEDKELCERIRKAGYRIIYEPNIHIHHDNADSFKRIFTVWTKGARGRVGMIKLGKRDFYTILFRYNIFLMYALLLVISLLVRSPIFFWVLGVGMLVQLMLCIKAVIDTGSYIQSVFVKPFMDPLSAVVISVSVMKNRLVK